MKNDFKELISVWKSEESALLILVYGFLILISTPIAVVWRVLYGIIIIIFGVLKAFKIKS